MRLLDLCCGAGGAAGGYLQAGFTVTGVDTVAQPDYPGDFEQADALEFVRTYGHLYDVVHASPPCQASSTLTKGTNNLIAEWTDEIGVYRRHLREVGKPYVIENVVTASLRPDLMLCGTMFDLPVLRHRVFEVAVPITQPLHRPHQGRVNGWRHGRRIKGSYLGVWGQGGYKGTLLEWQQGLDTPWITTRKGLANAIPPAYTHHIGNDLRRALA